MATTGEYIDRIRLAYGIPITGERTEKDWEADEKVIDALLDMWRAGNTVGKRSKGGDK